VRDNGGEWFGARDQVFVLSPAFDSSNANCVAAQLARATIKVDALQRGTIVPPPEISIASLL
jgi:hypothetical protein